jgi:hypothetical protein|tara:strand:+ start:605 stop:817 length:213 start_codon:yes stop_codon:yes gene_type:complete
MPKNKSAPVEVRTDAVTINRKMEKIVLYTVLEGYCQGESALDYITGELENSDVYVLDWEEPEELLLMPKT